MDHNGSHTHGSPFQEITDVNTTDDRSVDMKPVSAFRTERLSWLLKGRVALGKLTLLAGDPGLGKSFLTLDMAARVTREGGQAALLSAEDDPGDTIRPRLEAMNARLDNVHVVKGIVQPMGRVSQLASLDTDVQLLAQRLKKIDNLRLVVIDPISAYMGRADSHNNAEVRRVLADLARLAQWTGAAVVCVTHLNKDSSGKKAVYRAMGSLAFTAAARTVHLVTKHPESPSKRVVSVVKNNLSEEKSARVYTIEDGRVVWSDEVVELTSDQLEGGAARDQGPSALDEAKGFLREALSGGERPVRALHEEAAASSLSRDALNKAKRELGVVSRKNQDAWFWSLPGDDDASPTFRDDSRPDDEADLLELAMHHGYEGHGYV